MKGTVLWVVTPCGLERAQRNISPCPRDRKVKPHNKPAGSGVKLSVTARRSNLLFCVGMKLGLSALGKNVQW